MAQLGRHQEATASPSVAPTHGCSKWAEPVWVRTGMTVPLTSTVGVAKKDPVALCCVSVGLVSAVLGAGSVAVKRHQDV